MRRITGSNKSFMQETVDFWWERWWINWAKFNQEGLNPRITCHESQHIEELAHQISGGLSNPFSTKKEIDREPPPVIE